MLPAGFRPAVVSPLALVAPDGRTLLLAPLGAFHDQVIAVPRGVSVLGVHPQKLVVTLWEGVPDAPPLASSGTSP